MLMIKNTKSTFLLAAALLLGGITFAAADPAVSSKTDGAKQSLEGFANVSAAQLTVDLPSPVLSAVSTDKQYSSQGSGSNTCTPSPALAPGKDISPKISDDVRLKAIVDLLGKIAACKPLPYSHDGIINTNTEGGMPQAPKDFYKEYTLMVPGRNTGDPAEPIVIGGQTYMTGPVLSARGPERIIIGGGTEIYYTMDHYKTFLHLTIVK